MCMINDDEESVSKFGQGRGPRHGAGGPDPGGDVREDGREHGRRPVAEHAGSHAGPLPVCGR